MCKEDRDRMMVMVGIGAGGEREVKGIREVWKRVFNLIIFSCMSLLYNYMCTRVCENTGNL